jgi:hypothetical protein
MIVVKEYCNNEAKENLNNSVHKTIKDISWPDMKMRITIEIDIRQGITAIEKHDMARYEFDPDAIRNIALVGDEIAKVIDLKAYSLSTNNDHALSHLLCYSGGFDRPPDED